MEIQEKFLHHIWDQRHLVPDLKTVSGKTLQITYQGQYNTFNGPDFKNAVLNLGGETLQGDVEIHLKTYDWTAHQHHEDAAYNNTILHVVLEHKGSLEYTIREDAGKVEILELQNQIDSDIAKLFAQYTVNPNDRHAGACDFFTLSGTAQLQPLLQAYGWERFVRKCGRFNAELHFSSFDQLLYNGFMEALGYSKNKFNMLSIAHYFTWQKLEGWHSQGLNALTLAGIWLYYSGLMPRAEKLLATQLIKDLQQSYEYQTFTAEKEPLPWNLFRVRPANHPVIRILQASAVIVHLLGQGFLNSLTFVLADQEVKDYKTFYKSIRTAILPPRSFFEQVEPIGSAMLSNLTGNVILPIMYLYAQKIGDKDLMSRLRNLYLDYPPLDKNHITGFMQGYLSPEQEKLANASFAGQQGLLNLYYRFCSYRLCELCLADKQKSLLNL